MKVTIRVHDSLPPLRELRRFPSRVGATDERYLCLQVESRRHGRRLYCPGGKLRHRRIAIGVSSYGDQGAARKRDQLRAAHPPSGSRHGRTHPAPLAARSGAHPLGGAQWLERRPLRPGGGARRDGKRREPRGEEDLCADRLPDAGLVRGRLRPLQRVGCSVASPLVHRAGSSRGRRIALTFDDGPSPYTKRVLRILDRAGAKGHVLRRRQRGAGRYVCVEARARPRPRARQTIHSTTSSTPPPPACVPPATESGQRPASPRARSGRPTATTTPARSPPRRQTRCRRSSGTSTPGTGPCQGPARSTAGSWPVRTPGPSSSCTTAAVPAGRPWPPFPDHRHAPVARLRPRHRHQAPGRAVPVGGRGLSGSQR